MYLVVVVEHWGEAKGNEHSRTLVVNEKLVDGSLQAQKVGGTTGDWKMKASDELADCRSRVIGRRLQ